MRCSTLAMGLGLGLFTAASAGDPAPTPIDAMRDAQDISLDIRAAVIEVGGAAPQTIIVADEDAPPTCVDKAAGSLDIVINLAALGFPVSQDIVLTGTALSETTVRFSGSVDPNQCVSVPLGDTEISALIRTVSVRLTMDAAFTDTFSDDACLAQRTVVLTTTGGDAGNFIDVEAYALCLQTPFTRADITARGVVVDGAGGEGECPGDVTGDGVVNFADLNLVLNQFGQTGDDLAGDINGDGAVNFSDLNAVLNAFGKAC